MWVQVFEPRTQLSPTWAGDFSEFNPFYTHSLNWLITANYTGLNSGQALLETWEKPQGSCDQGSTHGMPWTPGPERCPWQRMGPKGCQGRDAPAAHSGVAQNARRNQKGIQGSKVIPATDPSESFHTSFGAVLRKSSPAPENLPGSRAESSKEEVRIETNK